jgi:hypothetical protein
VNLLSCRQVVPFLLREGTLDRARSRTPNEKIGALSRNPGTAARLSLFQLLDINQELRCLRSDGQATRRIATLYVAGARPGPAGKQAVVNRTLLTRKTNTVILLI